MKGRSGIPWPAFVVVVVALSMLAAACGGGGGKAASSSSSTATLKIRDQAAQLRAKSASAFAAASDGQGLSLGDTVKTNGTGFAQLNYHDGSLTRLDANAQFTLSDLSTASQAQRVVGTLDAGRAWSNVQKITSSDGRYEIDTSVATASVRGTRFNIDCTASDGSCTFTVVDGVVTVTPKVGSPIDLQPGDSLTVHRDGTITRSPTLTPDQLRQDAWIAKNLTVDTNEPPPGGSSSSSSSAGTGTGAGAALTVDACSLLSDAEVIAYANSIGGDYKAQPPLRVSPAPAVSGAQTTDAAHQHFCTWGFDQAWDTSTANDAHVQVTVERLAASKVSSACSLSASSGVRTIAGVGDKAVATNTAELACVLVGDVQVNIEFDGATQNPTASGDGVVDSTVRALATKVGSG